jgi:hypothetical protein
VRRYKEHSQIFLLPEVRPLNIDAPDSRFCPIDISMHPWTSGRNSPSLPPDNEGAAELGGASMGEEQQQLQERQAQHQKL